MATVHIIGAGISGLASATWLAERHVRVKLYEATAHAGGRCRTGRAGDHGLHMIAAGDKEIGAYLARVGSADTMAPTSTLKPPAAPLFDYLNGLRWLGGKGSAEAMLPEENILRDGWLRSYARARLGTLPENLPAPALRRRFLGWRKGGMRTARGTLEESFVRPALDYIEYHGGSVYFSHALSRIERNGEEMKTLVFGRRKSVLEPDDVVIVAGPPALAQALLDIDAKLESHSAITLHFAVEHREADGITYPYEAPMDVLRYRAGEISASLRIADHAWARDEDAVAQQIWKAIRAQHLYLESIPMPDYKIWREKKAGHGIVDAPPTPMEHGRVLLAGDWLDPLNPAALESAAASGHRAAARAMEMLPKRREHRQSAPLV